MAFKISSDIIINDSSQFPEGTNITNLSGVDSGSFSSSASGHTKNLGWGTSLVELTAPDVDYSTGVSNILNFDSAAAPQGANPHRFILKLTGNENRSGFGKNTSTQVSLSQPFGGGAEMQSFEVSRDGLHWYFYDHLANKIKHYTPSTAWAWNSLGGADNELTLGAGVDSSGGDGSWTETLRISEEGNFLFRGTRTHLYRYDMSSPWDLSTASLGEYIRWPVSSAASDANEINRWDIKRDGTKIIQSSDDYSISRLWNLETPWSIDSSSMVLNKRVGYGIRSGQDLRVAPENTYILGEDEGIFSSTLYKTEWLTPWHLDSTYSTSFGPGTGPGDARVVISTGQQGIGRFAVRPGGHYYYGLEQNGGPGADILYLFRIEDSTGNQVPQTFAFPPNVHFEDGYIDFPGTGETSYVEFISIDSGDNWYAKELYKG